MPVQDVIDTAQRVLRTGKAGDGKIFLYTNYPMRLKFVQVKKAMMHCKMRNKLRKAAEIRSFFLFHFLRKYKFLAGRQFDVVRNFRNTV
ncbi:hypothetical protein GCM10020331_079310 [Ectobacillus funiculus]